MARSLVVGGAALGDDADAFGLQAESDDFALVIVSDLLERTDGSHVFSPVCVSSPRPPRPRSRQSPVCPAHPAPVTIGPPSSMRWETCATQNGHRIWSAPASGMSHIWTASMKT